MRGKKLLRGLVWLAGGLLLASGLYVAAKFSESHLDAVLHDPLPAGISYIPRSDFRAPVIDVDVLSLNIQMPRPNERAQHSFFDPSNHSGLLLDLPEAFSDLYFTDDAARIHTLDHGRIYDGSLRLPFVYGDKRVGLTLHFASQQGGVRVSLPPNGEPGPPAVQTSKAAGEFTFHLLEEPRISPGFTRSGWVTVDGAKPGDWLNGEATQFEDGKMKPVRIPSLGVGRFVLRLYTRTVSEENLTCVAGPGGKNRLINNSGEIVAQMGAWDEYRPVGDVQLMDEMNGHLLFSADPTHGAYGPIRIGVKSRWRVERQVRRAQVAIDIR